MGDRVEVALKHETTGEVKTVKVGLAWPMLFAWFFGIPCFVRRLHAEGGVCLLVLFIQFVVLEGMLLLMMNSVSLFLLIALVCIGNELTAKNLLQKGFVFSEPESEPAQKAQQAWGLPEQQAKADAWKIFLSGKAHRARRRSKSGMTDGKAAWSSTGSARGGEEAMNKPTKKERKRARKARKARNEKVLRWGLGGLAGLVVVGFLSDGCENEPSFDWDEQYTTGRAPKVGLGNAADCIEFGQRPGRLSWQNNNAVNNTCDHPVRFGYCFESALTWHEDVPFCAEPPEKRAFVWETGLVDWQYEDWQKRVTTLYIEADNWKHIRQLRSEDASTSDHRRKWMSWIACRDTTPMERHRGARGFGIKFGNKNSSEVDIGSLECEEPEGGEWATP